MSKAKVMTKITNKFGKTGLKIRKYSPQIFMVLGVGGVITGTVLACVATTKVNEPIQKVRTASEKYRNDPESNDKELVKSNKNELVKAYTLSAVDVCKLYAPAAITGAISISCILTSNKILNDRYVAASTACASAMAGFSEYRARVREKYGDAADKALHYNTSPKTVETTEKDEKTGKEKKSKKKVDISDLGEVGPFTKVYDESCKFWDQNMDYNLNRLKMEEEYATHTLRTRGYMSINDVYERIGFDPVPEGQIYGWVYERPGDYISFGIDEISRETQQDFADGCVKSLVLNFNVQGNILDRI